MRGKGVRSLSKKKKKGKGERSRTIAGGKGIGNSLSKMNFSYWGGQNPKRNLRGKTGRPKKKKGIKLTSCRDFNT